MGTGVENILILEVEQQILRIFNDNKQSRFLKELDFHRMNFA